ncbi:MAG: Lrp/AsnC family transcriptional regulator [Alphaproteobacteria bacterium]|nr:Lrp/AsnC family transcriptional regulator [Alphaproteobacteria bacterium]
MALDDIDRRILKLLQANCASTVSEISEQVGLSTTPCWRRIQHLEKEGYIKARVCLADAEKLNVGVTVFVRLQTTEHNYDWLESFSRAVESIDEVVEFHRMSGDIDYLLKIVVPNITAYDAIYKRLIRAASLSNVTANFAMETIKSTTALPVTYAE